MRSFNEDAFQAAIKENSYKGLEIMNEMNPNKAREIFNFYFKLNEQIDVSALVANSLRLLLRSEHWVIHQEDRK